MPEVKQSMNETNAAQSAWQLRNWQRSEQDQDRYTAAELRRKDRLHGVGIAEQRKAIVDGLAELIKEFKGANVEAWPKSKSCLFC